MSGAPWRRHGRIADPGRSGLRVGAEQADLEVEGAVDHLVVGLEPAVGDPEHEFGTHDALDVDAVDYLRDRGQHLAGELELPQAERPAAAGGAEPAEKEA